MTPDDILTISDKEVQNQFDFFLQEEQKRGLLELRVTLDPAARSDTIDIIRQILHTAALRDAGLLERYSDMLVARREPHADLVGDLMTKEEFIAHVDSGMFIDYDGWGNVADVNVYDGNIVVRPSEVLYDDFDWPEWATHVVWYNR